MIPKIIHYCWFGRGEKPDSVKRYIDTWKQYCRDYEIMEWNEDNFDVSQNVFSKEAYQAKKWAFVTDYARLKILYEHGGIYMDTDVEVCKSLDQLLEYEAFSGFESSNEIPTGIMGAEKNNEWVAYLLSYYDGHTFIKSNGEEDITTNVKIITHMTKEKYNIALNNEKQYFGNNMLLLPYDYLCAKNQNTGKVEKSDNTYTIHYFSGTWLDWKGRGKQFIKQIIGRFFGEDYVLFIKKMLTK